MTEEEKEAIETMKRWIEYEKQNKDKINKANDIEFYLRTALNLVTRLEKENKYWKDRIEKGKKDVQGLKIYEIGIICEDLQEEIKETMKDLVN